MVSSLEGVRRNAQPLREPGVGARYQTIQRWVVAVFFNEASDISCTGVSDRGWVWMGMGGYGLGRGWNRGFYRYIGYRIILCVDVAWIHTAIYGATHLSDTDAVPRPLCMCLASLDEDNAEGGQTRSGQGPHRTASGRAGTQSISSYLTSLTPIPGRSQHSTCSPGKVHIAYLQIYLPCMCVSLFADCSYGCRLLPSPGRPLE